MRRFDGLRSGLLVVLLLGPPSAGAEVASEPLPGGSCTQALRDAEALVAQVRSERDALARRERIVKEMEQTGAAARRETDLRLQELERLRAGLDQRLARLEAAADERVALLSDLYGRMQPERAAAVIDALDPELAAKILGRMRRTRAAAVLGALSGPHAAEISRRLLWPHDAGGAAQPLASSAAKRRGSGAASVP